MKISRDFFKSGKKPRTRNIKMANLKPSKNLRFKPKTKKMQKKLYDPCTISKYSGKDMNNVFTNWKKCDEIFIKVEIHSKKQLQRKEKHVSRTWNTMQFLKMRLT